MSREEVWVTDPHATTRNRKIDWQSVIETAVQRPGNYLLVDDNASNSMASYINREGLVAFRDYPDYTFHATSANTHGPGRNRCHLYLRATKRKD